MVVVVRKDPYIKYSIAEINMSQARQLVFQIEFASAFYTMSEYSIWMAVICWVCLSPNTMNKHSHTIIESHANFLLAKNVANTLVVWAYVICNRPTHTQTHINI